jgi:hypothetical protein
MRRLVPTFVVLLLGSGCASVDNGAPGSADSTPVKSASAPATPSPSETPRLTVGEAATRYLEVVRPYNEALEALETAINTGQPVDVQRKQAASTVAALRAEIDALRGTRWPADVEPHAMSLAAASEQAIPSWETAAAATTPDDLVAAVLAAMEHDDQAAADAIRELLALDQYDEGDYSS